MLPPSHGLFTEGQRRLLGFLFGQPDRAFHARELAEITGGGAGATHRALRRLEVSGLARARIVGARKYYKANRLCSIYPELVGLVRKTFGLSEPLREAFGLLERRVEVLFVFDAFDESGGHRPPLELLLVTREVSACSEAIDFAVEFAEQLLCRRVRVLVVAPEELRQPRWYLGRVLDERRTWVFGDEKVLGAITSGP